MAIVTARRRVLVTGGRDFDYPFVVFKELADQLDQWDSITVVHGDCPTGADADAKEWATRQIRAGMKQARAVVAHEAYPALWADFDKAAGPMRNRYMVDLGAEVCLAFPTLQSRGTISCMKFAEAAGIPVINVPERDGMWSVP